MRKVYIGVIYMTHPEKGSVDDELSTDIITMNEDELSPESMERLAPNHYTWCCHNSLSAAKNWVRRYCKRLMDTNSRVVAMKAV